MNDYLKQGTERTYDRTDNGETIYREVGTGKEYYEDTFGNLNPITNNTGAYDASDDYYDDSYEDHSEESDDSDGDKYYDRVARNRSNYIGNTRYPRTVYVNFNTSNTNKKSASSEFSATVIGFLIIAVCVMIWKIFQRIF